MKWFGNLKEGLKKSRESLRSKILTVTDKMTGYSDESWESLEEILIQSDIGVKNTIDIIKSLKESGANRENLLSILNEKMLSILGEEEKLQLKDGLNILIIAGVNGTGKTTTIAKLASAYIKEGKNVLLAAADTFRAAAIGQIEEWAKKIECEVIKGKRGSNPSSVVYDACEAALARNKDILIIDTAGRLHTYENLMNELKKIKRVAVKVAPGANIKTLLLIDATFGQNAIVQSRIFRDEIGIDGIILTKLDGTAKGGIALTIKKELDLPIYFITFGESLDQFSQFNPEEYIKALIA
ncbi:MAG: signal recognition particle-docking protein FtsY [Actinomycetia bacterium]|nr:signal recognition particle-docking protein FtsY [Actinomycetes bacterium]